MTAPVAWRSPGSLPVWRNVPKRSRSTGPEPDGQGLELPRGSVRTLLGVGYRERRPRPIFMAHRPEPRNLMRPSVARTP